MNCAQWTVLYMSFGEYTYTRSGIAGPSLADIAKWLSTIVTPINTVTTNYFKAQFECIVYIIVVLICISLKFNKVEHLSMCYGNSSIDLYEVPLQVFCPFSIRPPAFFLRKSYIRKLILLDFFELSICILLDLILFCLGFLLLNPWKRSAYDFLFK